MTGFNCHLLSSNFVNLTAEDGLMKAESQLVTKGTPACGKSNWFFVKINRVTWFDHVKVMGEHRIPKYR
jgi:hypothetical protein